MYQISFPRKEKILRIMGLWFCLSIKELLCSTWSDLMKYYEKQVNSFL